MNKNLIAAGIGLAGSCLPAGALPPGTKVLNSALAGSWYDADPARLRSRIMNWIDRAALPDGLPPERPIALIQPHAGYAYSGPVAACGVKTLVGRQYDRVIIIGPSHRVYLPNRICIPAADAMATPLGTALLDRAALDALKKFDFVLTDDRVHLAEHSVQIQLPFLQCAPGGNFKIIPVIAGQLDEPTVRKAAAALSECLTPDTLVVISSDFTHFGRDFHYLPFHENIAENLRKLDLGAFELIRKKDAAKFAAYLRDTGATICGETPIRILLAMLPAAARVTLLKYTTSSAESGDYSHCVSYVSGLVAGQWETKPRATADAALSDADKIELLKMARESIEYVFRRRRAPPPDLFTARAPEATKKVMACFVTLKLNGNLRGCIGEIEPFRPLYQSVAARAVDAAFRDSRFPQLTAVELPRLEIEISALTPAQPVASYREIVIGKHGMTLSQNGRSAVFLPQVAPEQGWDLPETLTFLARKAGLPPDAWRAPDARFTVFEAIVFKEADFPAAAK